jgi:nucleolar protein 56
VPTERARELLTTWFGTFLVEGTKVLRESRFPDDERARADRLRARREGHLAPEEEAIATAPEAEGAVSRDRRFERLGIRSVEVRPGRPSIPTPPTSDLRRLLLADAETALRAAWDPSIHLDEAVRAMADVDRTRNLVGERLASWAARDRPELSEEETESGERVMRAVLSSDGSDTVGMVPEGDPVLLAARASLARSYRELGELRRTLDAAVSESASRRLPNLSALLGPTLAARLVSQAGGLERLARLPSSTVQVLGAERAFFDHLRRGSRPPRHGLLFLHPSVQGAPRSSRGRLARALAGKVAIAARLDEAGRPVDPSLAASFHRRAAGIGRPGARAVPGSRPPLDRAAEDG